MLKILIFTLFLFSVSDADAKVVKLGDMSQRPESMAVKMKNKKRALSCLENTDCPFDRECVALQCENVCKNALCPERTYCVPAGKDKPHTYQCVQCVVDIHCEKGLFCDKDYTCKKKDPCSTAVCSPAAPFCLPVPYETLPYTCVQCLENEHCPPVAGLTRRCVDGYCLFNVEGNIPVQETTVEKTVEKNLYRNEYDVNYEDGIEYESDIEYEGNGKEDEYMFEYDE